MDENQNATINAMPTKALFVEMLTRDIALVPAIMDLVDNCCDGAKRERGEGSLLGLSVRIEISPNEFRITDNCGGMSAEIARRYAFRFGRDPNAPSVAHSIGQFGVGMKRALFKIGKHFTVQSVAENSRFQIDVDVDKWVKDSENWRFEFDDIKEGLDNIPMEERGTTITISRLRDDVSRTFGPGHFQSILKNALRTRLQVPLSKGLAVTLNQVPISFEPLLLFTARKIAPAFVEKKYSLGGKKVVRAKIYCGLGDSAFPAIAGWHIYCNGRLILEGDKTSVTGWGEKSEAVIPQFHPHFNYFRGCVYLDCDDSGLLPWNTTKTGLNTDSPIYRSVLSDMVTQMRPVIDFLNKLAKEKNDKNEDVDSPLERILSESQQEPIENVLTRSSFIIPTVTRPPSGPPMQKISPYERPQNQALKAREKLGVTSWKAVGEKTFDYFYRAECAE